MTYVGSVQRDLYERAGFTILKDDVIITDERVVHVELRHPGVWEPYRGYLREVVDHPDRIFADDDSANTAILVKAFVINGKTVRLRATLRFYAASDPDDYVNSILSYQTLGDKRYRRMRNNHRTLYNGE
ncbi:MAG: hypothetical protein LBK46_02875 [Oscillospiraceae bacterium]|nr:hypothetical protein [Oscillospiraceae bacterium]